jgi:hypothetical protein
MNQSPERHIAPPSTPRNWAWMPYTAITAGLIVLIAISVRFVTATGDHPVYTTAALNMLKGGPVYLKGGDPRATTAPFTYPPFFAVPFIPLALLPEPMQQPVWLLVSLASLAVIVRLIHRCVRPALVPAAGVKAVPVWAFWLVSSLLVGRYVLSGFEVQTHDVLVFLLVMLSIDATCRAKEGRAGLFAGVAAACKATPLLFGPVFLWQRRWIAATCVFVAAAGATLLPDVIAPSSDGHPWVVTWYKTFVGAIGPGETARGDGGWPAWSEANQSLGGTMHRLSALPLPGEVGFDVRIWQPSDAARKQAILGMRLAVLGIVLLANWPRKFARPLPAAEQAFLRYGQSGTIVCAMLLLSPQSSKAHFGVLLIPVTFCVADFLYRRRDAVAAGLLGLMFFLGTLTVKGVWGRDLGNQFLARGTVTWCTVACLIATTYLVLRRSQALQAAALEEQPVKQELPRRAAA